MDGASLLYFIVAVFVLIWSGSLLVKHLTRIAQFLKLSEFTIGFILMALATSLPEVLVGVQAAISGVPELSLGDVIGSNILDMTLIFGLVLVLSRRIVIESAAAKLNINYVFFISLVPVLLLADRVLSRFDGVILLCVFLWYVRHLYVEQKEFTKKVNGVNKKQFAWSTFLVIIGAVLLIYSSYYTVQYASAMAIDFGLPLFFVGIMMLAFGTSLPELVFETKAVLNGHKGMALGDLYGSVVFNSTIVLAITALINPIVVSSVTSFIFGVIFLVLSLMLFLVFVKHGTMSWQEGIVLVL
ncbi:MAG: sodium:calcium antiporter, partial [Candidatus Nanoarchaeia archaeon]